MRNRRTMWLAVVMAALGFGVIHPPAAADVVDGIAAQVNDRVITYSDVRQFVEPTLRRLSMQYRGEELRERIRAAQRDALEQLIDRALILEEFKSKGYSLPEATVDERLRAIIAEEFGNDRAAFVKTLAAENITLSAYRQRLREQIIVQAMRQRKVAQAVIVSPYKIEKYYSDNVEEFRVPDQIKLRMIVVRRAPLEPVAPPPIPEPPISENQESETEPRLRLDAEDSHAGEAATDEIVIPPPPADPRRALAEEILSKLDAGESFSSMAAVYSEGSGREQGGDWGWITRDVLRKELSDVAFSLKAGEHSRVVETPEAFYILYVEDVKPAHLKTLAEVRDHIERILLQQERMRLQDEWLKSLREKAYVRLY
jgi:peptidyl-prolyl cis-trans isomerase SurA